MKKFPNAFRAFRACKAVKANLAAHANSDFARHKKGKAIAERYQAYLDLDNWAGSPLLVGLSQQAKTELRTWGIEYTATLTAFHDKTASLEAEYIAALKESLYALGVQAGQEFMKASGRFARRLSKVTFNAGSVRCNMLDGKRYVSVFEENSNFAKGFFQATGLTPKTLALGNLH